VLDQYKILRNPHGVVKKFSRECWAQASCLSPLEVKKNGLRYVVCPLLNSSVTSQAHGVVGCMPCKVGHVMPNIRMMNWLEITNTPKPRKKVATRSANQDAV